MMFCCAKMQMLTNDLTFAMEHDGKFYLSEEYGPPGESWHEANEDYPINYCPFCGAKQEPVK